ncbi:DUF192 domain-containing protein [Blastochloris sulfoviridis]|nr:DUF192 domain-containing protein [Blastochloris sulfoviridis]
MLDDTTAARRGRLNALLAVMLVAALAVLFALAPAGPGLADSAKGIGSPGIGSPAIDLPADVPPVRFGGPEALEIATRGGVRSFDVELAVDEAQRARGLMYRRSLPAGRGMLFDFGAERDVAMWMQNTYVSLDMVFIRSDGRIARVAERATPLSTATISSGEPVRFVLELPAGTARALGIAAGDQVAHRLIGR